MKKHKAIFHGSALMLILCLSGCAKSIVYWNQATESFDQAAALEMQDRFARRIAVDGGTPPAEAVPSMNNLFTTSASATGGNSEQLYRLADEKVSKALEVPAPLKKEDKLANALTLKALTCWKTGQPEAARLNAAKALQEFANQQEPSPRDEPLAKAIPGLVALDLAHDTTQLLIQQLKDQAEGARDMPEAVAKQLIAGAQKHYEEFVTDANNDHSIAGAQRDLQAAMELAGENKDMQIYLLLSQLTGLKNQFDLWAQLDNFAKRSGQKAANAELRTWISSQEETYLAAKDAALEKLKELMDGNAQNRVYRFWDGIL